MKTLSLSLFLIANVAGAGLLWKAATRGQSETCSSSQLVTQEQKIPTEKHNPLSYSFGHEKLILHTLILSQVNTIGFNLFETVLILQNIHLVYQSNMFTFSDPYIVSRFLQMGVYIFERTGVARAVIEPTLYFIE